MSKVVAELLEQWLKEKIQIEKAFACEKDLSSDRTLLGVIRSQWVTTTLV